MEIENLTLKDIEMMDYNQIIGIIKETNRIPGGKNTIFELVNRTCLDRQSKVLEIGTSTGFTAIEISKLVPCNITSIDINKISLEEAKKRAIEEGLTNINFVNGDVISLPFKDQSFDLVIVGNVFSLLYNKDTALKECKRVCKKNGFIAAVPMYYLENPNQELIESVSKAIQVKIKPMFKRDWERFFETPELEVYFCKDFKFDYIEDNAIEEFTKIITNRAHLFKMQKESLIKLQKKYKSFMYLFRDNLSTMGFSIILICNKRSWEDPELYTSKEVIKES
jgi:ubiquinone/menaquinone biosynthesis C-methylase UbiE